MLESIVTILGIIVPVLAGVWFIVYKAFGVGRFTQRVAHLENRTCNAACDTHDRDIVNMKDDVMSIKSLLTVHDKDITDIKEDMRSVKDNLTKVSSLMLLKYKEAGKLFSIKNSPRQLNDIGKQVFSEIRGEEFLQTNKDFLFSLLDSYHPKTALDVENAAHAVCAISTDSEIFNGIKNFVYNSSSYSMKGENGETKLYDLSLPDVCFILSLPLRDMYLAAHPEILSE